MCCTSGLSNAGDISQLEVIGVPLPIQCLHGQYPLLHVFPVCLKPLATKQDEVDVDAKVDHVSFAGAKEGFDENE